VKENYGQLPRLHGRLKVWFSEIDLFMTEIRLKKGEPVEKAIRRLKKKLDREQTLLQVRLHRRFEKPSARKRRKTKAARFSAMLKARYADD
jgi:small subunit ribosomal protein S21